MGGQGLPVETDGHVVSVANVRFPAKACIVPCFRAWQVYDPATVVVNAPGEAYLPLERYQN
jgi:hypothetical protein